MQNLFAKQSLRIAAGTIVSGVSDRDQIVRVECGKVWITIEGSRQDYWLRAGQSVTVVPGRLVVIEADVLDSRVSLPAMRAHPFRLSAANVRTLAYGLLHPRSAQVS